MVRLTANAGVACGDSFIASDKECHIGESTAAEDWQPDNLLPMAEFETGDWETPEQAGERRKFWGEFNKARDLVHLELIGSNLSNEQKREYLDNAQHVLIVMPKPAVKAFNRNVERIKFYGDTATLTETINRMDKKDRSGATVGGVWEGNPYSSRGTLHLDGDLKTWQTNREVYAHEFGHACDWMTTKNPLDEEDVSGGHRISWHPDWQRAYHAEIAGGKLTKYATTSPTEGFAEFARLCWTGERPKTIAKEFPQCYAVFKQHGLVT